MLACKGQCTNVRSFVDSESILLRTTYAAFAAIQDLWWSVARFILIVRAS